MLEIIQTVFIIKLPCPQSYWGWALNTICGQLLMFQLLRHPIYQYHSAGNITYRCEKTKWLNHGCVFAVCVLSGWDGIKKLHFPFSCGSGSVSADMVKYWCGINSRLIRVAELIEKRLISWVFFSVEGRFWSEPRGCSLWCAAVHKLLNMNYFS